MKVENSVNANRIAHAHAQRTAHSAQCQMRLDHTTNTPRDFLRFSVNALRHILNAPYKYVGENLSAPIVAILILETVCKCIAVFLETFGLWHLPAVSSLSHSATRGATVCRAVFCVCVCVFCFTFFVCVCVCFYIV